MTATKAGGLVVVTGANGFVGSRMNQSLRREYDEVFAWTRELGDLRDREAVLKTIRQLKPELIVHLASAGVGSEPISWSAIADEQRMLSNLAEAMPTHCQLIYSGSMAEYGRSGHFGEIDFCSPDTAYGCAKYSCSTLALALRSTLSLDIRVVRLYGVYGPGEVRQRLLPTVMDHLDRGLPIALSDGTQVRDFIHVDDVCVAVMDFARLQDTNIPLVNIGTGVGISVRQVCETVADIVGADRGLLRFGAIPRRSVDQDCLVAKTENMALITPPPPQRWLVPEMAIGCVDDFRSDKR